MNESEVQVPDENQEQDAQDGGLQQDASQVDTVQTVVLDDSQWLYVQSVCGFSLGLSLASLLLCGCIFGSMLSHYLGRAVNRG